MGMNSIFSLHIYRTGFKVCFHDTETFFDFPTLFIYPNDCFWLIFQICADSIKTIILFFNFDDTPVYVTCRLVSNFSISSCMVRFNKTFWIILPFLCTGRFSVFHHFFCTFNLPVSNGTQIISVFNGIRYNQLKCHKAGILVLVPTPCSKYVAWM